MGAADAIRRARAGVLAVPAVAALVLASGCGDPARVAGIELPVVLHAEAERPAADYPGVEVGLGADGVLHVGNESIPIADGPRLEQALARVAAGMPRDPDFFPDLPGDWLKLRADARATCADLQRVERAAESDRVRICRALFVVAGRDGEELAVESCFDLRPTRGFVCPALREARVSRPRVGESDTGWLVQVPADATEEPRRCGSPGEVLDALHAIEEPDSLIAVTPSSKTTIGDLTALLCALRAGELDPVVELAEE